MNFYIYNFLVCIKFFLIKKWNRCLKIVYVLIKIIKIEKERFFSVVKVNVVVLVFYRVFLCFWVGRKYLLVLFI